MTTITGITLAPPTAGGRTNRTEGELKQNEKDSDKCSFKNGFSFSGC